MRNPFEEIKTAEKDLEQFAVKVQKSQPFKAESEELGKFYQRDPKSLTPAERERFDELKNLIKNPHQKFIFHSPNDR